MSGPESDREFRFPLNVNSEPKAKAAPEPKFSIALPSTYRDEAVAAFDKESARAVMKEAERRPALDDFLKNARLLAMNNEHELAQNLFLAVLRRDPHSHEAMCGALECAKILGNTTATIDLIENFQDAPEGVAPTSTSSASATEPAGDFARAFHAAERAYEQGNVSEARRLYSEALHLPHMEGEALFTLYKNLGNLDMQQGDLSAAEENYNRAFTIRSDSDALMVNFGSLAIHRGDLDRAVRCFRQAVDLNAANAKAWIGLGVVHREFGDSELAWANIERALDLDGSNATAAKLVADWALKDNELETAIRLLSQYLEQADQDAFIHLMLSKFMYLLGRLSGAKAQAEAALALDPHLDEGDVVLAVIQEEIDVQARRLAK